MKSLHTCLADHDRTTLLTIARLRGVEAVQKSREDLASSLARELLQPGSVSRVLKELSPEEREALEAIIAEGGRMKEPPLVRSFGEVRRLGELQLQRLKPWENPAGPAEDLYYRGLIFRGYDIVGAYHGPILFIPPDLLALLPSGQRAETSFQPEVVPQPSSRKASSFSILEESLTYLSFLQKEAVKPKDGEPLPVVVKARLSAELGFHDEVELRLAFLHQVCREAKLIGLRRGQLKPLPGVRSWLRASRARQLKALFDAWAGSSRWNELWHVRSLRPEPSGWRNDPRLARQAVLGHLRGCPSETWVSVRSMTSFIRQSDPDFQRPDGDYSSWHIRDSETGEDLAGFENWFRVEGSLIAHLISHPLNWLGVLDMSFGEKDQPSSFFITALGAHLLGMSPSPPPEPPAQPLVVGSDFQVLASPEVSLNHRFHLARFAELESRDVVNIYRITRESVWAALDGGIPVGSILSFLQRASGGKAPQNVLRTLGEWAKRHGEIQLERTALLRTRNAKLLEELRALPEVQPYIKEVLSPRSALVDPQDLDRLLDILRRLGYAPRAR
jgi:hypothetical protein